jgi:hypothetical protein
LAQSKASTHVSAEIWWNEMTGAWAAEIFSRRAVFRNAGIPPSTRWWFYDLRAPQNFTTFFPMKISSVSESYPTSFHRAILL